jgi:phage gpG-like protein
VIVEVEEADQKVQERISRLGKERKTRQELRSKVEVKMLREVTIDFEKESSAAMEQMKPEHKF